MLAWSLKPDRLKGKIQEGASTYQLVEVKSIDDVPQIDRSYGHGEIPPANPGKRYSDKIRNRDVLNFVITDLSEQSPFHSRGEPYKFGPVEIPEDGNVEIPYVGEIQVMNRTLAEVSADLSEKVKPVSNTARAAVTRATRLPQTANVIGDVKKPGPVPLDRGASPRSISSPPAVAPANPSTSSNTPSAAPAATMPSITLDSATNHSPSKKATC